MNKFIVIAGLAVAFAMAAGALGFMGLSGDSSASASISNSFLSPVTEVRGESEAAAGQTASRGCGSASKGCGSARGGGCCSSSTSASGAAYGAGEVKVYLQEYYGKLLGEGVTVEVKDLGCHQEAEIRQSGRLVTRLSISGGTFTELS